MLGDPDDHSNDSHCRLVDAGDAAFLRQIPPRFASTGAGDNPSSPKAARMPIHVSAPGTPLNKALYLFYALGFLFVGGAFVLQTSGADLRMPADPGAGSALSQSILAFFYVTGALLLVKNENAMRVLERAWPMLLLPTLAVISAAWSPEPALTLRRAIAFMGTTLFGLSLGAAYKLSDGIGLITRSLTIAALLSCAIVLLDPRYGLHQPSDAIQAVHAGLWRGIFAHRNTLGLWAGAALGIVLIFGNYGFRSKLWRAVAFAAALACLIGSRSAAGYLTAVLVMAVSLTLLSIARQPAGGRGALVVLLALVAMIALLMAEDLAAGTLYLLGKESDLTGRTLIWYYLLQMTEMSSPLLGTGYFAGLLSLEARISSVTQVSFVSAHNGYLEAFVYLGFLGLLICIAVLVWLLFRAVKHIAECQPGEAGVCVFPASILFVAATHNLAESTIVLPNNLIALLVAVAASMLGQRASRGSYRSR
jgi:O-antigen ligase